MPSPRTAAAALVAVPVLLGACAPQYRPPAGSTHPPADTDASSTAGDPGTVPARPRLQAVNDRDFLPAALEAVDGAAGRVRVAEFLLYDTWPVTSLLDALGEAAARGVQVSVLADEEGSETEEVLAALDARGVETRLDSPGRTLHNKLIVADDVVLVGSHNLTGAALEDNHEGSVRIADPEVAAWFAAWFDAAWERPEDDPRLEALSGDVRPVADRAITGALLECLDAAAGSVEVLLYAVAWDEAWPGSAVDQVLTALERAHARGVDVAVVLDGSDWIVDNRINDAAIARLRAAGVAVWLAPASVTTHAKVLRCDDTVVVSDANWSYSGLELMHGTSAVVEDPGLAADYAAWIAGVRESGAPVNSD